MCCGCEDEEVCELVCCGCENEEVCELVCCGCENEEVCECVVDVKMKRYVSVLWM